MRMRTLGKRAGYIAKLFVAQNEAPSGEGWSHTCKGWSLSTCGDSCRGMWSVDAAYPLPGCLPQAPNVAYKPLSHLNHLRQAAPPPTQLWQQVTRCPYTLCTLFPSTGDIASRTRRPCQLLRLRPRVAATAPAGGSAGYLLTSSTAGETRRLHRTEPQQQQHPLAAHLSRPVRQQAKG